MAGTTDFLPFATGGGALVESQASYAASSERLTGFQVGIAEPDKLNKVWRQAAFVSAALAKFTADQLNADVPDDGNQAAFITQFADALKAYVGTFSKEILVGNADYFVSDGTGDDTTGTGTALLPWKTIQHAYDFIQQHVDGAGYAITLHLADGTYTGGLLANTPILGSRLFITGNIGAPGNVFLNTANQSCIAVGAPMDVFVQGVKMAATGLAVAGQGSGINCAHGGNVYIANCQFDVCTVSHIASQSYVSLTGPWAITGASPIHAYALLGGKVLVANQPVAITGTLNFSDSFLRVEANATTIFSGVTFSAGDFTGLRFNCVENAVINDQTTVWAASSTAGTTSTGGQHV